MSEKIKVDVENLRKVTGASWNWNTLTEQEQNDLAFWWYAWEHACGKEEKEQAWATIKKINKDMDAKYGPNI